MSAIVAQSKIMGVAPEARIIAIRAFSQTSTGAATGTSFATVQTVDATPIIEFNHDVGVVEIRGVSITSPRINWGNDEGRIRSSMLVGEPRFREIATQD